MKDEYDFTNAEQGKSYVHIEELDIPIYLDRWWNQKVFFTKAKRERRGFLSKQYC